jgi:hypothetical protein
MCGFDEDTGIVRTDPIVGLLSSGVTETIPSPVPAGRTLTVFIDAASGCVGIPVDIDEVLTDEPSGC